MSTLVVSQTRDFRALAVAAPDGIGRIEFDHVGNATATFRSGQFANGRSIFEHAGISDTVVIDGVISFDGDPDSIDQTFSTIRVVMEAAGTFSAAGWTFAGDSAQGTHFADVILEGSSGNDTLTGTTFRDTFIGNNGADAFIGGGGTDTASYLSAPAGGGGLGVQVVMLNTALNTGHAAGDSYTSIENLTGSQFQDFLAGDNGRNTIFGLGGNDTIFGQGGNDTLDGGLGDDTLNGQADDDHLRGFAGKDTLVGGAGEDELDGGVENDTLEGGLDADELSGGDGTDTASYVNAASAVRAFLLDSGSNTGEADGDTFSSIENLTGSGFNDTLAGTNGANFISGGDGQDTILGENGNDTLNGNSGNDTLEGGLGRDALVGGAGASGGIDTASYANASEGVLASLTNSGLNGGEALGDTYSSIENLTGSAFFDILQGDGGANTISGGDGNDVIAGENGNDALLGGLLDDFLTGGEGNDRLEGGDGNDELVGGIGVDTLLGGAGIDRFTFEAGNEVAAGEIVNGGAEQFLGFDGLVLKNAGSIDFSVATLIDIEVLSFHSGTSIASFEDSQIGGPAIGLVGGNTSFVDTLVVNGADIDLGGVTFSQWSAQDAILLNGTSQDDSIVGSDQNDTVSGGSGQDEIAGGEGDDLLQGGLNGDTMSGGKGNDRIYARTEALPDGSSAGDTMHGNDGEDLLVGSDGADQLVGGKDNDALHGGRGNDKLTSDEGDDVLIGGEGVDTVFFEFEGDGGFVPAAPATVDLRQTGAQNTGYGFDSFDGIENLVASLGGSTFTGSNAENCFEGNRGGDEFHGGSGNDTLLGNLGEDLLIGDAGEDFIDGGSQIDRLFGGSSNDQLFGGADADTLIGGPGIDRLDGGDGADRLYANGTADTFVFANAAGTGDRVFSFVSGLHDLGIHASVFGGAAGPFTFVSGAAPTPGGGQQALLYDTDNGKLFFDADGNGVGALMHLLTLVGAPALAAADIVLV